MAARLASSRFARFAWAFALPACNAAPAPTAAPVAERSPPSAGTGASEGVGGTTLESGNPVVTGRVRRLTRLELENTLNDLLGEEASALAKSLEPDNGATKFSTAADRGVSTSYVSDLNRLAQLAASHLEQARESHGVSDACTSDEASATACASAFIRAFAGRAWRRPVTDEEVTELLVVYQAGLGTTPDAEPRARLDAGLDNVVRAVLQAPSFVFRTELGDPSAPDGGGPLTPFEAVAALSYGLTASPPDDELQLWAAQGEPVTTEAVMAQGRRLLKAHPQRYARQAEVFVREWLSIDLASPAWRKDLTLYPRATPELKAALDRETTLFLQQWAGGSSFVDLLTMPRGYVSRSNAWMYGVADDSPLFIDGAPEFSAIDLDPRTRAGVLTLPAFLGSLAHESASSPVLRGVAVMRKLLCLQPPPVPAMIPPLPPADTSATPTTRARYEQHTSVAYCKSCHQAFDPMGYTFEHYDAIGAYRDLENGVPIDSTGALLDGESSVAEVADAVALASLLASSAHVHDCFVRQAYRFTSGQKESAADADALSAEAKAFEAHDLNVAELMLSLVANLASAPRSPSRVEP